MAGLHDLCNGHELGQTSEDGEGQGGLVCHSPWGRKESDMTGRLINSSNMIRVSCNYENKHATATYNNMDESHKHTV